nr:MAG TPA: hypothetical protein [Caudoviricetes sp.]
MIQQLVLVPMVNGQFAILNKTYYENLIKLGYDSFDLFLFK